MVKFAIGNHNKWVPIILSRSAGKESRTLKKQSGASVNEDKRCSGRAGRCGSHSKGDGVGVIKKKKLVASGSSSENTGHSPQCIVNAAPASSSPTLVPADRPKSEWEICCLSHAGMPLYEGVLLPDHSQTQGSFVKGLNEITEVLTPESTVDTARSSNKDFVLQGRSLRTLLKGMAAMLWMVSKASTLASSVIMLRWHSEDIASEAKAASSEYETFRDAEKIVAAPAMNSSSVVEKVLNSSDVLLLPSPSPLLITSISTPPEHDKEENAEAVHPQTTGNEPRRCKVKGLLKMHSAPSTPRDTRQRKKPFTAAITNPNGAEALQGRGRRTDGHVAATKTGTSSAASPPGLPGRSVFQKVSTSKRMHKESARRAGHALAEAGLLVSLIGLVAGYVLAIIGLVCWWYMLPMLRKTVGDRPTIRSHHRNRMKNNNARSTNAQAKGNKINTERNAKRLMANPLSTEHKKAS